MPNVAKAARALYALHRDGLLKDDACKAPVVLFIRQATESQETRHWHATTHYRSTAAKEFLRGQQIRSQAAYQRICKEKLSHEHMVPNIVLYRMILEESNISESYLVNLFRKFGLRATITRPENGKLLTSSMPADFFTPGSDLYMNPLARYINIGLHSSLELRTGNSWYSVDG